MSQIKATIIADSINDAGTRITTFELEYPRFIHAEMLTHRTFSRNSASSRAIPINTVIELVNDNPAMPTYWGANQSGMQASREIHSKDKATEIWLQARDLAVYYATQLRDLNVHKQIVNRLLEPFQMMKVLVTATSYDNFFALRYHKDAQPEIQEVAKLMYEVMQNSTPELLHHNEWHTPYVEHDRDEQGNLRYFTWVHGNKHYLSVENAIKISCSCSAQVSYRKNNTSLDKAISIYDRLVNSKPVHASAFEHCATPIIYSDAVYAMGITHLDYHKDADIGGIFYSGNFKDWVQYRQLIPNHDCKEFNP